MPDIGNTSVFSQTDASNGSGTQPSWLGSAAPSTLDDAGRALQGAVTREWNWRSFTLTATGTANAKVLTYSVAPAAYYNGQRFAFIANTTNTTTATLNVNSLGAKTIKKLVAGVLTNLSASDMVSGMFIEVAYNTANDCVVWVNQSGVFAGDANTFTASQIISVTDNTNAALRVTQLGTGLALRIEDETNPDSSPFVVDSSGNVGIGTTTMTSKVNYSGAFDAGTVGSYPSLLGRASYGGGVGFFDTAVSGIYTQSSGTELIFFTGQTGADTAASKSRMAITTTGVTIGGNPVIAAAGTAAQGDVLYYNGTAWTRLAAGTSGQFLKTNGAGANPAWASETVGGITNLGTITTTSGASQSLAVTLTGYKFVRLSFNGVSGTGAGNILVGSGIVVNGPAAADLVIGTVDIDLTTGYATAVMATTVAGGASSRVVATGYSTATTSIVVSLASGTLDAGSVVVYGLS